MKSSLEVFTRIHSWSHPYLEKNSILSVLSVIALCFTKWAIALFLLVTLGQTAFILKLFNGSEQHNLFVASKRWKRLNLLSAVTHIFSHITSGALIALIFFSLLACASCTGVLEKTVEGEAVALTKAKTLYKSCTNESESPCRRCWRWSFFYLQSASIILNFYFFHFNTALEGDVSFSLFY